MKNYYKYSNRAVAFLDVLGFQNKLKEFEEEAIGYYNNHSGDDCQDGEVDDVSDVDAGTVYYSKNANDFIETFNNAISKLDKEKFSYYLFSDNICITAQNAGSNSEKLLVELLLVISELFFEFMRQGYFLRGGIDYGLFIEKSSIALGVPLATAYKMESSQAVFPRILLSGNFIKQLEDSTVQGFEGYSSILASSLVKSSCEIHYLNVFNHVFKVDDKEFFFECCNQNINDNLRLSQKNESIFLKYRWLADEFNSFIESYTASLAYLDENFEATNDFIQSIQKLKIVYGQ